MTKEDQLSGYIIRAALEAHRTLGGPGLLESVYEEALAWELREAYGLQVDRQKQIPILYKGNKLAHNLCIDLMVNELVIVECKAVETYNEIYEAQALTYLRLTGLKLALVINFGERLVTKGVHRVVNKL